MGSDMQCNAPRWIVRLRFISQFLQAIFPENKARFSVSGALTGLQCIEMLQANDGRKIHGP
jgi:hypothetical protein